MSIKKIHFGRNKTQDIKQKSQGHYLKLTNGVLSQNNRDKFKTLSLNETKEKSTDAI